MTAELDILQSTTELVELLDWLEDKMAFKCPNCSASLPDKSGQRVLFEDEEGKPISSIVSYAEDWNLSAPGEVPIEQVIHGSWLRCLECDHVLVRFSRIRQRSEQARLIPTKLEAETWWVIPRRATRAIDPLVPPELARDYREASAILTDSHRMSAVLSRRILADLLEEYARCTGYTISEQVNKFLEDPGHPSSVKENLHYLREISDFSAHTKKDKKSREIIEVTPEEAEWTLDVVDGLFDYFIVRPKRDEERRTAIDKKLEQAGRKPIRKPPEPQDDKIEP